MRIGLCHDDLILSFLAPSGAPQNFTILPTSSQAVYLSWDPPVLHLRNGEITLYTINVSVVESAEMFQFTSVSTEFELLSLKPYHTYMFTIAASTSAGLGPFSVAFTLRMPEDSKTVKFMR